MTHSITSSVLVAPQIIGSVEKHPLIVHGRRALLTGGRAKIGMYIALKLLRDGADLTITTRFPKDAVRRFSSVNDSADLIMQHRQSDVVLAHTQH